MITFTERAHEEVLSFLGQSGGELEALRISLREGETEGTNAPNFDLTLVALHERAEDEREVALGDFTVFVRETSVDQLEGATVDYVERVNESGFEIRTRAAVVVVAANGDGTATTRPATPPTGEIADRVREVLDNTVNPAIASHGGLISLIDVHDTEISVEMSGGCQGCALSSATLRQGVERMLREAVPELTAVHDITDHSSGENPYL
jgi:Fe/S biogenesis protein NfuA